jgi:hypothetical protein
MFNPWLSIACDAARLGFEAQWVIAARMMRLAAGGALAETELHRMISEKTATFVEAQMMAAGALARGRKSPAAAREALGVYRKRVRRNRRRLSRSRRH